MRERVFCCSGSPIIPKREGRFNKNGRLKIEIVGETNLYDYIQSFKESVDINVILKRFLNGDVDALSRTQGFYGDITEFPKTYAEMLNRIREGEEYFNSLPVEVKQEFGNDAGVFLAGLSDGSTFDVMMKFQNKNKLESEVRKDAEVQDSE